MVRDDYGYLKLERDRPVVFLDLDGVLNNALMSKASWYREAAVTMDFGYGDYVERHKARMLFALLRAYRVQVVIVSSWVRPYLRGSDEQIGNLRMALEYEDIVGSIHTGGGEERGQSVMECVRYHGLERWAIVDDSDIMYDLTRVGPNRLFSPHGRYGITDELLEQLEDGALCDDPEQAFVAP